jgi:hypothetical protein
MAVGAGIDRGHLGIDGGEIAAAAQRFAGVVIRAGMFEDVLEAGFLGVGLGRILRIDRSERA